MKIRYSSLTELEYPTAFHEVSKAIIRSSVSAVFFNRSEPLSFSIVRTLMCTFHQYVMFDRLFVDALQAACSIFCPKNCRGRPSKFSSQIGWTLFTWCKCLFLLLFVAMLSKSCWSYITNTYYSQNLAGGTTQVITSLVLVLLQIRCSPEMCRFPLVFICCSLIKLFWHLTN